MDNLLKSKIRAIRFSDEDWLQVRIMSNIAKKSITALIKEGLAMVMEKYKKEMKA